MKKIIGIILIALSLLMIGYGGVTTITKINSEPKKENNNNENGTRDVDVEITKGFYVKSTYLNTRNHLYVPNIYEGELNCADGNEYEITCLDDAKKAVMIKTRANLPYEELKKSMENAIATGQTDGYEKTDCIDNAFCFKKTITYKDEEETDLLVVIKSTEDEVFYINYYIDNDVDNNIKKILDGIKMTNDATYTVGEVKDGKLIINLRTNANNINAGKLTLKLDSSKYTEVEDRLNSTNTTTVQTKDGHNIHVFVLATELPTTSQVKTFTNLSAYYYFGLNLNPALNQELVDNLYKKTSINGIDVYKEPYEEDKEIYGLYTNKNYLLVVGFDNAEEKELLKDFTDFDGNVPDNHYVYPQDRNVE